MIDTATMAPIHPGEILREIVNGKRGITADTALRLARYFGTSERFWLNLQSRYELEIERDRLAATLDRIQPLAADRAGETARQTLRTVAEASKPACEASGGRAKVPFFISPHRGE